MKPLLSAAVAVFACASVAASAPKPKVKAAADPALRAEIARMDKAMFDAFNGHDANALMALFSEDLEFYHDKEGLVRYEAVRNGFTSMFAQNNGIRRDLVPGSLEVYPIGTYGAIEIGAHRFCHVENGKNDCGVFKFLHVWRKAGDRWQVTRVVSWGH
jgi:ketosteroid isomerase-like protein